MRQSLPLPLIGLNPKEQWLTGILVHTSKQGGKVFLKFQHLLFCTVYTSEIVASNRYNTWMML